MCSGLKIQPVAEALHYKGFNKFTIKSVMGKFRPLKAGKLQHEMSEKQCGIGL